MNIVVKEHFKKRYCERILKILDKKEIAQHILNDQETLIQECVKLFENATLVWTGKIGDFPESSFYINDSIIIVANYKAITLDLITLYCVDYGFPHKTNTKVAKDLLAEIEKQRGKLDKSREKAKDLLTQKMLELENTESEIRLIEEQSKVLRQRKHLLNEELEQLKSEPSIVEKEIEKFAVMLCNSLAFKMDLISLNNGKRRT